MELDFRRAGPADADALVPLIHESSRELIDTVFSVDGRPAQDFLRRDFLRGEGLFGWRNQKVAIEPNGAVVATATHYPGRRWHRITLHSLGSVVAHYRLRELAEVCRRSTAVGDLFATPDRGGLFLANICVSPEHRNQGVGTKIVRHLIDHTRSCGLDTAELDVSATNIGARRLYERIGFEMISRREDRSGRLPAFERMRAPAAIRS
ncbi:GNAT family N-acetyltransferase [Streptomyces inhibens]|nr:GNAT family N-acetyltransferase [Streptomyces inhibens]